MRKNLILYKQIRLLLWMTMAVYIPILQAHAASSSSLNPPILINGSEVTEQGTVIENVTELAQIDGPAYLRMKKENGNLSGSTIKVIYSPGEAECRNILSHAFEIKEGTAIEVHGLAVDGDTISTCDSTEYYIKVRQH